MSFANVTFYYITDYNTFTHDFKRLVVISFKYNIVHIKSLLLSNLPRKCPAKDSVDAARCGTVRVQLFISRAARTVPEEKPHWSFFDQRARHSRFKSRRDGHQSMAYPQGPVVEGTLDWSHGAFLHRSRVSNILR